MPSKEIIVKHEDFANYCLPITRFYLSPTDDTDEHGFSFYRTRMTLMNTEYGYRKNKKEPIIGACSASNVICADIHL